MYQAILLIGATLLVGIDQLTKWLALEFLKGNPPVRLIDGIFSLEYTANDGIAFGMLGGLSHVFIPLTAILLIVVAILLLSGRFRSFKLANVCGVMILGGGVGNMIDRIGRGEVVDFFHFEIRAWNFDFPIFNMADVFVVVGALLLLVFFLFIYKDEPRLAAEEARIEGDGGVPDGETALSDGMADQDGGGDLPAGPDAGPSGADAAEHGAEDSHGQDGHNSMDGGDGDGGDAPGPVSGPDGE